MEYSHRYLIIWSKKKRLELLINIFDEYKSLKTRCNKKYLQNEICVLFKLLYNIILYNYYDFVLFVKLNIFKEEL